MEGWICLQRKFLDWEWFDDAIMVKLFVYLLLKANFEPRNWRGIEIGRGQIVTGRHQLSAETHLSEQQIRTGLRKLESTGEITIKATNKFTIITISNYARYQDMGDVEQPTKQPTNNQQSTNNQPQNNNYNNVTIKQDSITITAESAKNKNPKPKIDKKVYGEYANVALTDIEAQKLYNDYGDDAAGMVEYLSAYKVEKNYKTKSDYLTIRRWVADAYQKSKNKNSYGNGNDPTGNDYVSTERIVAAGRAMAEARR